MLPLPERTTEELNECLERRMQSLVSDLLVIEGMTRRGAELSEGYRRNQLQAIHRFWQAIYEGLDAGIPAVAGWHMEVYGE